MIRTKIILIVCVAIYIWQTSCKCTGDNKQTASQEQVAEKKIEVHIMRLEKDLFSVNIDSVAESIPGLIAKYKEIFDLYNYKVIGLGSPKDPKYPEYLKKFITDYYMNLNYNKVLEVYPDLNKMESEFSDAFTKYVQIFPKKRLPQIFTCISGWNQSVVTSDTLLGIALDKYLGRNCEYYEKLGLDKYKRYTLQREYIVPDALRTWGYTEFGFSDSASNVLSNILYEGKILYFVKQLLPETPDSIIMGFSDKQMKWCSNNGSAMWTYLAEHKMLFSSDYLIIHKLVYPAPFTYYFTNESPGRAAVLLGYKIIVSYMNKNSNVTLPELMENKDYQKILRESGFKP